jgi:hypothetical protein
MIETKCTQLVLVLFKTSTVVSYSDLIHTKDDKKTDSRALIAAVGSCRSQPAAHTINFTAAAVRTGAKVDCRQAISYKLLRSL